MCKNGFDFEFNPAMLYYCSAGEWNFFPPSSQYPYSQQLPWPDCSSKLISLLKCIWSEAFLHNFTVQYVHKSSVNATVLTNKDLFIFWRWKLLDICQKMARRLGLQYCAIWSRDVFCGYHKWSMGQDPQQWHFGTTPGEWC